MLGIFFQDGYKHLKGTPFQYQKLKKKKIEEILVFMIFMICLMKDSLGSKYALCV